MKYIAILLFSMLAVGTLQAQSIDKFSTAHEEYLEQLEDFLKATKRDECKEAVEEFIGEAASGKFTYAQMDAIIATSNMMLDRKMQAYPYFLEYLEANIAFLESGYSAEMYDQWNEMIYDIAINQRTGENKPYQDVLEFSQGLFEDGSLYRSQAKTWVSKSRKFDLVYEDGIPKLIFPSTTLYGYVSGDTTYIRNTGGTFNPSTNIWSGNGGDVHWGRAGMDTSVVYAKLYDYELDVSRQEYSAKDVDFYFTIFFDNPIKGTFTDKLVVDNKANKSSYPRFVASDDDVFIESIAENVSYQGAFSLNGSNITGTGGTKDKAEITFYLDDGTTKALVARAEELTIRKPVELYADNCEITLYFGNDSIYHPGLRINFKIPNRELRLFRGKDGVNATPFYDSFHQQEINVDAIFWQLGEKEIELQMIEGGGQKAADFESVEYYDANLISKIRGTASYDPLSKLKMYTEMTGEKEVSAASYAQQLSPMLTEKQTKPLLYLMVKEGFIDYDEDNGMITMKDKTPRYVLAKANKIDFDVLKVQAIAADKIGTINLENFDIRLDGVQSIPISDTAFVYVFPDTGKVTIKNNRDMQFNGMIFAGRTDIHGKGHYFSYENFSIDIVKGDSLKVWTPKGKQVDSDGKPVLLPVMPSLQTIVGQLKVDFPKNKSGRSPLKQFPMLSTVENSYAYYDKYSILGGIYDRSNFYFQVDPFDKDSLKYINEERLYFDGKLVSAGIFPEFQEKLRIQPDLWLGFVSITPAGGYDIYGGHGTYNDTITLNKQGLRGSGDVGFLASTFHSYDIIFYPDSTAAMADEFTIAKTEGGQNLPAVTGSNNRIGWLPYQDDMRIRMTDEPFAMYEDQTTLFGNLNLTADGLQGNGKLDWAEATLTSDLFDFRSTELESDTASLEIKSIDGGKVTFNTPNVYANVDFEKRFGHFESNTKDIQTEFAYNQYKTSIDVFDWDIEAKLLDFTSEQPEGAYFESTHPEQNGLKFRGKKALYSLETSILDVSEVAEIIVADSRVIPAEGKVTIDPEAAMRTLEGAKIEGDTLNAHHVFTNVTVDITGKRSLSGTGEYVYKSGGKEQTLAINEIGVEKIEAEDKKDVPKWKVYGKAGIAEEDNFDIYPNVFYKGDLVVNVNQEKPIFDGYAKIDFNNELASTDWFSIEQSVDPEVLNLYYEEPKNPGGSKVFAGMMNNTKDTSGMYTILMNEKLSTKDDEVFVATGIVMHNKSNGQYIFGNEDKIKNNALEGNVLRYDDAKGLVTGNGLMTLGMDFRAIAFKAAGDITNKLAENSYEFDLSVALDLQFNKDINEKLAFYLLEDNFDKSDITYDGSKQQQRLAELVDDDKQQEKMFEELNLTGVLERPKSLFHNMLFTDVKMVFDPVEQTFRSEGDFGLSMIADHPINKEVEGWIEFGFRNSSDYFNIYIETSLKDWVYITYKSSTVQIVSSYDDLNELLTSIDTDKRRIKNDDGYYIYSLGSNSKMKSFVERMKSYEE